MMRLILAALCCFIYSTTALAFSNQVHESYPLKTDVFEINISKMKSLSDEQFDWQIAQGVEALNHLAWQEFPSPKQASKVPQGITWLSFSVQNRLAKEGDFYLVLQSPKQMLSAAYFTVQGHAASNVRSLDLLNNNQRVKKIRVKANQQLQVLLRVNTLSETHLSVNIMDNQTFLTQTSQAQFVQGIAIGGMLFLSIAIFFLFFATGQATIILLSGYFFARALLLSTLLGSSLAYYFPSVPDVIGIDIALLGTCASLFFLWFTAELFGLKRVLPTQYKMLRNICWLLMSYLPVCLFLTLKANFVIGLAIHGVTTFFLAVVGISLVRAKQRLAKLFTFIVATQFLLGFVNVLATFWNGQGVFEHDEWLYSTSFWLNGILITFLVSRQYYYTVKDRQVAQQQALENANATKVAQDELLAMQEEAQQQLETSVQERTLELNIALQELEEANRELAEKSTIDDLSGLYNRRFYDQKITAEFRRSRRNLTPLSLVLVDIDHFKQVNDNHGHLIGDKCIHWMSQKIKHVLRRSTDVGCRYGGEEFCLILPETDAKGAKAIAEELRNMVQSEAVELGDAEISLTISCGVSCYQQQADANVNKLFVAADKALYSAKQNGRNQVKIEDLTSTEHREENNE